MSERPVLRRPARRWGSRQLPHRVRQLLQTEITSHAIHSQLCDPRQLRQPRRQRLEPLAPDSERPHAPSACPQLLRQRHQAVRSTTSGPTRTSTSSSFPYSFRRLQSPNGTRSPASAVTHAGTSLSSKHSMSSSGSGKGALSTPIYSSAGVARFKRYGCGTRSGRGRASGEGQGEFRSGRHKRERCGGV